MSDANQSFFDSARKMPLLTNDEEILLARRVRQMLELQKTKPEGPYTPQETRVMRRGQSARHRMITANIRLVTSIANKYCRVIGKMQMGPDDILQEGLMGLIKAVERFDPERGYKLSTYAYWWIRQSIGRSIDQTGYQIRIPLHIKQTFAKASKVQAELAQQLGREPLMAEIAEALGVSVEEYRRYLQLSMRLSSLDAPAGEGCSDIMDFVSDENDSDSQLEDLGRSLQHERLLQLLNKELTDKQRFVVMAFYGIGMDKLTYREMSKRLGCHHEACRQTLDRATRRLRMLLAHTTYEDTVNVLKPWVREVAVA